MFLFLAFFYNFICYTYKIERFINYNAYNNYNKYNYYKNGKYNNFFAK